MGVEVLSCERKVFEEVLFSKMTVVVEVLSCKATVVEAPSSGESRPPQVRVLLKVQLRVLRAALPFIEKGVAGIPSCDSAEAQ